MSAPTLSSGLAPASELLAASGIPPRRLPLSYRIGLALSAGAMVVLPLVYVGLIGAVLYGVWLFATRSLPFFQGADVALWICGYGGVIGTGLVVVAFLIKPLFAPKARPMAPATLDLDQQSQLRTLIAAISQKVGAPMPVRVDVDCSVNASARLRRGLLSLGRRDLVLTIGLPLTGRLTARQLAGVVAHELGHFAQGAGMATTYIIRTVNSWFARVVFERDEWDETIAGWSRRIDIRVGIFLWVTRGAIWVSRKILHGLMVVGHAIACWQLRQMEFDADYYEVHVGGTDAFEATTHELRRLNLASGIAFTELGELWRDRRLVDDFPGYLMRRREDLAEVLEQRIEQSPIESARWFYTHPLDSARVDAARALAQRGLCPLDFPASGLFNQFEELCREASAHYYRETLELEFEPAMLLTAVEAARPGHEEAAGRRAFGELAGTVLDLEFPLLWSEEDFATRPPTHLPAALAARLAGSRAQIRPGRAEAETASANRNDLRQRWTRARLARELFAAGVDVSPVQLGFERANVADAEAQVGVLATQLEVRPPVLAAFEASLHGWVVQVVSVTRLYRESLPPEMVRGIESAASTLVEFRPWLRAFPQWSAEQRLFAAGLAYRQILAAQRNYTILGAQCEKLRRLAQNAPALVEGKAWPLSPPHAPRSTKEQVERAIENETPAQHLAVVLSLAAQLYFNALGKIAYYGAQLETVLANSDVA